MAEAPADPSKRGHLEQKILQVLREASSPLKTHQLVKECQVTKKELNQALHRMAKEETVSLVAPATWRLGAGGSEGENPTQTAQLSRAQKPQPEAAAVAESPGPQLSELDDSGRRNQSAVAICQQNPIYMIYQNAPNSCINITNSEAIQIGHGNILMKQRVSGDLGPMAPHQLPTTVPGDSSAQGPLTSGWGPQDIHMERSLLRRVQVGHGNEMSLHSIPSEGPAYNLSGSPPVSARAAGSEASFEVGTPQPGPHPEATAAQRVHIKSCFLEDAAIGDGNRMTVLRGTAAGPAEGRQDGGAPEERADPGSEAHPSRSDDPQDGDQEPPGKSVLLTPKLRAMALRDSSPHPAEPSA
ncbi:Z-DNA-binding protein 1 isoform X3 [Sciurus carolinensis]|uniref:Z-DNA-binding protein 1 isoform X3 n=1 Tax=Sciurus carolinensis TaxID=30640 RepID=UPI001FB3B979|nr:Z-DNA-binding protein 1 isoform X3 [Sciurus carolinensis]